MAEKRRTRRKTFRRTKRSWILTYQPLHVRLRLQDDCLEIATLYVNLGIHSPTSYVCVALDRRETQAFFIELGEALGYEMPSRHTRSDERFGISKYGADRIVIYAGFSGKRRHSDLGHVSTPVAPKVALRAFKALAPLLGWELYYKYDEVSE